MKTFYLLRHIDIHSQSGIGVVAEGVIFDQGGQCAMTWLTPDPTVTIFSSIRTVKKLHGHEGKTEVIIEGKDKRFQQCKEAVRNKKLKDKQKAGVKEE